MKILGLDINSYETGFGILSEGCFWDSGVIYIERTSKNKQISVRLSQLRNEVSGLLDEYDPDVLVLEDIFYDRKKGIKTFKSLAMLQGVVLEIANQKGYKVEKLQASEIRSLIGKGNNNKEEVAEIIKEKTGKTEFETLDESDALAICYAFDEKKRKPKEKKGKKKNESGNQSVEGKRRKNHKD